MPSAIGAMGTDGPEVWIVGGGIAQSNDDLAEIWRPSDTSPSGTTVAAAQDGSFPQASVTDTGDHPELAVLRPSLMPLADGAYFLSAGWFGARCAPTGMDPLFPMMTDGSDAVMCESSFGPPRSFTVEAGTGVAVPTKLLGKHAFGSSVVLSDGSVAITGGISDLAWTHQSLIDVFTGRVLSGQAEPDSARYDLVGTRIFHASAPLPGLGILTTGGISVLPDGSGVTLTPTSEAVFLGATADKCPLLTPMAAATNMMTGG